MSAATRHMAAVTVPARRPQPYAAIGRATCVNAGCLLKAGHQGSCLPAPRRVQGGAR